MTEDGVLELLMKYLRQAQVFSGFINGECQCTHLPLLTVGGRFLD